MTLKQVWHSRGLMVTAVWLTRIIVGALFVVSGLSKADDLWGFIYKIEEYLRVWNVVCPRSIVLTASMLISGAEFVLGSLLMLGLYRRSAPALLLLTMCGMLPLTLYIYMYAPVADCGCFGDFLILSNAATFWKNVALTV
ncbi:MAG: DoxX family membrane protein, partial [Paramuribaculum sp.]|nr:DoxX family membrane protein [Paramuribaculum sp.]